MPVLCSALLCTFVVSSFSHRLTVSAEGDGSTPPSPALVPEGTNRTAGVVSDGRRRARDSELTAFRPSYVHGHPNRIVCPPSRPDDSPVVMVWVPEGMCYAYTVRRPKPDECWCDNDYTFRSQFSRCDRIWSEVVGDPCRAPVDTDPFGRNSRYTWGGGPDGRCTPRSAWKHIEGDPPVNECEEMAERGGRYAEGRDVLVTTTWLIPGHWSEMPTPNTAMPTADPEPVVARAAVPPERAATTTTTTTPPPSTPLPPAPVPWRWPSWARRDRRPDATADGQPLLHDVKPRDLQPPPPPVHPPLDVFHERLPLPNPLEAWFGPEEKDRPFEGNAMGLIRCEGKTCFWKEGYAPNPKGSAGSGWDIELDSSGNAVSSRPPPPRVDSD